MGLHHSSILFMALLASAASAAEGEPAIVPRPVEMSIGTGAFAFSAGTTIAAPAEAMAEAGFLARMIDVPAGLKLQPLPPDRQHPADVRIELDPALAASGPETYALSVAPTAIVIRGATPAGVFDAIQTLRQLLPAQIESRTPVAGVAWTVPALEIRDHPRFAWRGLMLDVSRHFYGKAEIERLLDAMALHKLNVFHWHLVDDNGWRIAIARYPKLTEEGAWRKDIGFGLDPKSSTAYGSDGRYGGFYTRDDIREVVAFAAERHITIVPEIEMPGHSAAALALFPELSCAGKPGSNVYCAGNEASFAFLENVLDEVFALFPGKHIHIGGDEVDHGHWAKCAKCQERIKAEGLKNEHELQSYFIRRIERFVTGKGRSLVGWSEIRDGGLAQSATVMDWIGGAVEAASAGHDVVMSPTSHCYFDYAQERAGEPRAIGGYLPLRMVYGFDPIPGGLAPQFHHSILGAQGNVWTEYIAATGHMQYMAFPRESALAEVTWTPRERLGYAGFRTRLATVFAHLDALGVNYRRLSEEPMPVAAWKSGETSEAFSAKTWDITPGMKGPGHYEITFDYTGGRHRLDIEWAALLVDGKEAGRDAHPGRTGGSAHDNTYRIPVDALPAGARCELRASVRSDGGSDSNGQVLLLRKD
jgi:hexosaminidase